MAGAPNTPKSPAQEQRSLAERTANERALAEGRPLPFPSPWDTWDPTKIESDSGPEAIQASYARFRLLCRPRPRKRHLL